LQDFWFRLSSPLLFSALVALLLWALFSATAGLSFLLLVLLVTIFAHARQLYRLGVWLKAPTIETIPEAGGIWDEVFTLVYKMVKRHNQTKLELASELQYIQQATAALPQGVAILNEANRIEWFNPLAEQHFGLNAGQDIMQDISYLVRQPEFIEYLKIWNPPEPLVLKTARHDDLVLSIKLVPYGENKRLLISRDITQLERIETMRRDFVANVSHELRTPLTVVNGFVENLQDMHDLSPENIRHALNLMAQQTRRMDGLVSDLLTLSRLESEQNPLMTEVVDMHAMLQAIYQDGKLLSAGRHQISLDDSGPERLCANRDELRSAFSNLMSNAVRYSPEGGKILMSWKLLDGQPVFSVEDSGIGIEAEHLPRLAERFYRVDRSRSRGTGGTGLGLAIVKHIVMRHQAKLDIESEQGHGSTFSLIFPVSRIAS